MIPVVVIRVHSGNNGVGGGIRSGGKTSSPTSTRVIGGRHTSNHPAVEVAVGPVASLEVSRHGEDGVRRLSMRSLPQGVVSFIRPSSFHSSLLSHWFLLFWHDARTSPYF